MPAVRGLASFIVLLCACHRSVRLSVTTEPSDAIVQLDDRTLGRAPTSATLELDSRRSYVVSAHREGYFAEERVVAKDSIEIKEGHIRLVMMQDPSWASTTVSKATNQWMRVEIDPSTRRWTRTGTSDSYLRVISFPRRADTFQAIDLGGSPVAYSRSSSNSDPAPARCSR